VSPEIKQRLAESFETALRLADGRAVALEMDTGHEHMFSSKFACPICAYSLQELEPRLFSFNNPMGACPHCDGLGQITFFDPKRVVAFPNLSLASGAIKGWDRRNQFYFQMLQSLAAFYDTDIDVAFEELPPEIQQIVLHGSGEQQIPFTYINERGRTTVREHAFAATRRPTPSPCARSCPSTRTTRPARNVKARACAARPATSRWARPTRHAASTRSTAGRCATRLRISSR
jgi:excinuclease ABC subunit A